MQTLEQRLNTASRELRKNGILIKRNVTACCQGCANPFPNTDSDTQPLLWSFGGQNSRISIKGNHSDSDVIKFNHSHLFTGENLNEHGMKVLTIFAKHGLAFTYENPHTKLTLHLLGATE